MVEGLDGGAAFKYILTDIHPHEQLQDIAETTMK